MKRRNPSKRIKRRRRRKSCERQAKKHSYVIYPSHGLCVGFIHSIPSLTHTHIHRYTLGTQVHRYLHFSMRQQHNSILSCFFFRSFQFILERIVYITLSIQSMCRRCDDATAPTTSIETFSSNGILCHRAHSLCVVTIN